MIPSVIFLFGCWFGCLIGLFLAGALSASREDHLETEVASFAARTQPSTLTLVDDQSLASR